MTIIFLSDISWFGLHQRPQHIALALSKEWNVLWVQPITLQEKSVLKPIQVESNINVIGVPALPYNARIGLLRKSAKFLSYFPFIKGLFTLVQFFLVKRALKVIDNANTTVGFFIHNFQLASIADKFKTSFVQYDYIDNAFGFTRLPKHIVSDWERTIKKSDMITVTSPTLKKQIEPIRSENIYYIGNGVEYNLFSESKPSENKNDLPTDKPIIGYIGAVYPWLDFDLIEYIASEMSEYTVVFVGTVHPEVMNITKRLEQNTDVRFLGFKEYKKIPNYISRFAVGIIPFQKNVLTASVNPVKLYEYSAAGKPTVATDFSDDLLQFKDKIFIAKSKEDFVNSIRLAVHKSQNSEFVTSLKLFAKEHDWQNKTSQIINLIHKHLSTSKNS